MLFLAGALTWALIGTVVAPGAPSVKHVSYSAPTFLPVDRTKHNNDGNSACGAFVPRGATDPDDVLNDENKGDLNTNKGSLFTDVHLPEGATVRKFSLYANDNDAEDSFAFLIRKRIEPGLDPQFKGYVVMASTQTAGAVNNRMRKFADSTIKFATIDNLRFVYYIEMVNCATIEPFAAQIDYTG